MKIGLLVEPYEEQNASGMGYLLRELASGMVRYGTNHEFVLYSSKPLSREFIPGTYTNILLPRNTIIKFFYFFFTNLNIDMFLYVAPLQSLYVPGKVKSVLLCQELPSRHVASGSVVESIKVFLRDVLFMKLSVKKASLIVVPTNATEKDVLQYYPESCTKIRVIPDGFQDLLPYIPHSVTPDKNLLPYFFFTGKVKTRKNVHRIVSAFILFKENTHTLVHLVIGGSYGGEYYKKMWEEVVEHKMQEYVHFVGYTSIEELCGYYLHALALVFTSLSEGFGMPILESMSLGTPVITSNISSMSELAQDAGILVDPLCVEEIARGMSRIYSDEALRTSLIIAGKTRAEEYSWERTGKEYMALLETQISTSWKGDGIVRTL